MLNEPNPGRFRSPEQPREEALPKRFYTDATVERADDGWRVLLDGRPVRTPGRAFLAMPGEATAAMVADEWQAQGERIDPRTMPATRLANTALDGVVSELQAVREDVVRYAGTDLVCYRADEPEGLVRREAEAWDPYLDWASEAFGAHFVLAEGIVHTPQPREAIAAFGREVERIDGPFRLAALHVMTALTGSALIALGVAHGAFAVDDAWRAAHVDEDWNIDLWGEDAEAAARRAAREIEMRTAARFATA